MITDNKVLILSHIHNLNGAIMKLKATILSLVVICITTISFGQEQQVKVINAKVSVGDYGVLELRTNKEDEFKTFEGGKSSMGRLAFYSGKGVPIRLLKGYEGTNELVKYLNAFKATGWKVISVNSTSHDLVITNYLMEKIK